MIKGHIVVVYGQTRSGKDTFLTALAQSLEKDPELFTVNVSSIDETKKFLTKVQAGLSIMVPYNDAYRTGLAEIKGVLDNLFNYTVKLAITALETEISICGTASQWTKCVLLYQLREIENIRKLRRECKEQGIGFTAVYVYRDWVNEPRPVGAPTDLYLRDAYTHADYVVINKDLVKMPIWADAAAASIQQEMVSTTEP